MSSVEVVHECILRLLDFGPAHPQVLAHSLTGEHCDVPTRHRLGFCDVIGFLETLDDDADSDGSWANDILTWSVHDDPESTFGIGRFVYSKVTKEKIPVDEYQKKNSCKTVCVRQYRAEYCSRVLRARRSNTTSTSPEVLCDKPSA